MSKLCGFFERTRQAFYKQTQHSLQLELWDQMILEEVKTIRCRQPRVGTRKLHRMVNDRLQSDGIEVGRDHLFELLRAQNLLIRRRRHAKQTTDSRHRLKKYSNLIRDLKITRPNQVYVADITYLETLAGFCYLALITDAYSRKMWVMISAAACRWRAACARSKWLCHNSPVRLSSFITRTVGFNTAVMHM